MMTHGITNFKCILLYFIKSIIWLTDRL